MSYATDRSSLRNWFRAEGGPMEVMALAWPLMLSTGLFALTLFVDRTFLFFYDEGVASGALGAGTMFWAMTCGPIGLLGFTSTFVAQYVGVRRFDRAVCITKQGILASLALGPVILFCAWGSRWFFSAFHQADLVEIETKYFHWIAVGAWAAIIAAPLNGLFSGTGRSQTILLVDAIASGLNVILDWLLIFGVFGFPELGIIGAALASSVSLVAKVMILGGIATTIRWEDHGKSVNKPALATPLPMIGVNYSSTKVSLTIPSKRIHFLTSDWQPNLQLLSRLFYYGWPAGLSAMAESISFSIIVILVGQLGSLYVEATLLALNVNLIAFIPMIGLGAAVGVLVGQRLTSGRADLAQQTVRSGLTIGVIYSLLFAIGFGLFPDVMLAVYSWGGDIERFEAMRPIVLPLLWFIAAYCIFDAVQIIFVGALKGAGDTAFVLAGNLICGLTCVTAGKIFGDYFQGKLYWWWGVIMAWVISLAFFFTMRYLHGGWLKKRVIEPELL